MTKRIVAVVLALAFGAAAALIAGCGGGSLPSGAMAKVGNVTISESDFNNEMAIASAMQYEGSTPDKSSSEYKQLQQQTLDFMVTYQLCKFKSESLGISVSGAEIQSQIDSDVSNAGSQSAFDAELEQYGLTLDQYKTYLSQTMLQSKAYNEVTLNVTATDKQISDYYNQHKSDYVHAETRTIRHILIDPTADRKTSTSTSTTASSSSASTTSTTVAPATSAEWAAALETAQKVRADLVAGASWTTEAKLYSDDTGTKDKGGALGTTSKGSYVAAFDNAAFGLKLNEISQPVKTIYGYHIIQVTAITLAKVQTLSEVKATISSTVLSTDQTNAWNKWVADAKKEYPVIIKSGYALVTTTTGATTTTK